MGFLFCLQDTKTWMSMYHTDFGLFIGFRAYGRCSEDGCLGEESRLRSSPNFLIVHDNYLNPQMIKAYSSASPKRQLGQCRC